MTGTESPVEAMREAFMCNVDVRYICGCSAHHILYCIGICR